MRAFGSVHRAADKTYDAAQRVSDSIPKIDRAMDGINEIISDFKGAPGNLTKTAEELGSVVKIGIGMGALKFCSDMGVSWYQSIKLTGIANDAKNAFKRLANNTIKTEDEVVNVLKNTSDGLKSSAGQFTEDVHKMGQNFGHMSAEIAGSANKASQNFGHMTESVSQSSAEIASSANQASGNFGYMTQDFHQVSRCFVVTCLSLTTSTLVALAASVTYLQESSCDRDKESMLCNVPLKSIAAAVIATGVVATKMLMPNRVQHPVHQNHEVFTSNETIGVSDLSDQVLKEEMDLNFLIPEEGIDQDIEWTEEQLDLIKATNLEVFNHIEKKTKFANCKWTKQELEWLLSQDKNIFLNVITIWSCSPSAQLNGND